MFSLKFKTDNAAFCEDDRTAVDSTAARDAECARILRVLADAIENGAGEGGKLFDINGNHVGSWSLKG